MSSLSVRNVSRGAPVPIVNSAARLELLEYYLAHHDDLARCAYASLDWLARYARIPRSVCLAVDRDAATLVGISGFGVPVEDVELFAWPLADRTDSLVAALTGPHPTMF